MKKYCVMYRQCNIVGWHVKKFMFKKSAFKFIDSLKSKNFDEIKFLIDGDFWKTIN